ncbi:MAG TPA: hypothetical protein PKL97_07875 [Candidatus Omnitrophota bacterium]|nr:hypothetical protein [Candidatus Omnitrophota bacterium]
MSIEEFPEIEDFHRLPRRVIVKGGVSRVNANGDAELSGIVLNNLGQPIKGLKVNLVVFDDREMPILNALTDPEPARLAQGGISSFKIVLPGHKEQVTNCYLYPTWQYDDSEWA